MTKKCTKCQTTFECMVDNIPKCHCYGVELNNEQRLILSEQYKDCLCPACLIDFSKTTKNVSNSPK